VLVGQLVAHQKPVALIEFHLRTVTTYFPANIDKYSIKSFNKVLRHMQNPSVKHYKYRKSAVHQHPQLKIVVCPQETLLTLNDTMQK